MRLTEPVSLAEGQVAASGAMLARAFADDPLFTRSLSDSVERARLLPPLMTAWTRRPPLRPGGRDRRANRGERHLAAAGCRDPDPERRANRPDRSRQCVQRRTCARTGEEPGRTLTVL